MASPDARRSVSDADASDPNRWRALSVTLVAGFMSLLDVSIVSVALPSLQQSLGADPAAVQWVVSGYALTFGLALVPAGRLGDALGRRRVFLWALAAFVLFSGLAGAVPNIGLLIAARLAQGLAAGTLAPQNSGLIQQLFRDAERGRAFGLFGATVGISTAVGPVVGGLLLALVPAGRLGDALGRRRMFLGALSAFVLFSGLAGAAPCSPARPAGTGRTPATPRRSRGSRRSPAWYRWRSRGCGSRAAGRAAAPHRA